MTEEDICRIRNAYFKIKGGVFNFKGNSMEPTLKEGDMVQIMPVDKRHIRAGDIVVFHRDTLVCHRILGRFKQEDKFYFWEKGDNPKGGMRRISEDEIIGKVVYLIQGGKFKKPKFYFDTRLILLIFLEAMIYPYIVISGLMKKYLFFGKKNPLSRIFGTIAWKIYYFYFDMIAKNRYPYLDR